MPTENRSSNTEMVSFPRELSDDLAELIAHRARVCGGGAFEIWEAICEGFGKPAEQHQGEPVALPADWQDQLMAEMSRRFELSKRDDDRMVIDDTQIGVEFASDWVRQRLITHADHGEVERLRAEFANLRKLHDSACDQLAERDALLRCWMEPDRIPAHLVILTKRLLSASAEPSAPVEGNPSALVDQLQADITARDEELDRVRTVVTTVRRKACLPSEIETLLDSAISCPNR